MASQHPRDGVATLQTIYYGLSFLSFGVVTLRLVLRLYPQFTTSSIPYMVSPYQSHFHILMPFPKATKQHFMPINTNSSHSIFENNHSNGMKTHYQHNHFQTVHQFNFPNYFTRQTSAYLTYASSKPSNLMTSNMTKTKHHLRHIPIFSCKLNISHKFIHGIHIKKMMIYIIKDFIYMPQF